MYDPATSHHATWLEQEWLLLHAWICGDKHLVTLGKS